MDRLELQRKIFTRDVGPTGIVKVFHAVLQFPYIAGPTVLKEASPGLGRERELCVHLLVKSIE